MYSTRPKARGERIGRLAADARQPPRRDQGRVSPAISPRWSARSRPSPAIRSAIRISRWCLKHIKFPEPVIQVAVEPKTKADQDKMGLALSRLAEEDPTFRLRTDQETGQTIIAGMGELHLEVIVDRMMREYQGRGQRRQPAGGLPREHHAAVGHRLEVRAAVRRQRPVRARQDPLRADGRGRWLRVRQRHRRRYRAARVCPGGRAGHSRGDGDRRAGRLSGGRRQGYALRRLVPRGRTRRRWRSRSRPRWRSRTACAKAARRSSSRS